GFIPVIVIKHILTVVGDENIVETIIVVVTHSHCRSPACSDQSSFDRYICKRAVAVIFVEPIRRAEWRSFQASSAKDKQVHPAIVIVVDEGHSTPNHLDDVALRVHTTIDNRLSKTCLFSDIAKMRQKWTTGRLASGLRLYAT